MPIPTEPVDKKYVRIYDTYDKGPREISYGVLLAKTVREGKEGSGWPDVEYYIIEMPDGKHQIHPVYACTEITEKEYFLGVLGGTV